MFRTGEFFVSISDNVFRPKFEKYFARIVQSGIVLIQKSYIKTISVKTYLENYFQDNNLGSLGTVNEKERNLGNFVLLWMQNGCSSFYSKEKCDFSNAKNLERPVKLIDFVVAWILLVGLMISSVCIFIKEVLFVKNVFPRIQNGINFIVAQMFKVVLRHS